MRLGLVNFEQTMVWVSGMIAAHEDCQRHGVDFARLDEELDWELTWADLLVATSQKEADDILTHEPYTHTDRVSLIGTFDLAPKAKTVMTTAESGLTPTKYRGHATVKGALAGLFAHAGNNTALPDTIRVYSKAFTNPTGMIPDELAETDTHKTEAFTLSHTVTPNHCQQTRARKFGRLRRFWRSMKKMCCCCSDAASD